jgi:head-tail adaptor
MMAGRLRNRVRIEQPAFAIDEAGSPEKLWVHVVERDASIEFVSGREFFAAGGDVSESTVRITLRECPELKLDGALRAIDVDSGAHYDITAVLPSRFRNDVILAAKMGGAKAQ